MGRPWVSPDCPNSRLSWMEMCYSCQVLQPIFLRPRIKSFSLIGAKLPPCYSLELADQAGYDHTTHQMYSTTRRIKITIKIPRIIWPIAGLRGQWLDRAVTIWLTTVFGRWRRLKYTPKHLFCQINPCRTSMSSNVYFIILFFKSSFSTYVD